jgi:hypothetical protein
MTKLKASEIAAYREQLLQQPQGVCGLCGEVIEPGKAVLDHDHKSGHIRGVLHRGCNAMEGVIVNNMARNLMSWQRMQQLFERIGAYQQQLQPELHPTHRTPEERKVRARKRALVRRKSKKP